MAELESARHLGWPPDYCTVCGALVPRENRKLHLDWHAAPTGLVANIEEISKEDAEALIERFREAQKAGGMTVIDGEMTVRDLDAAAERAMQAYYADRYGIENMTFDKMSGIEPEQVRERWRNVARAVLRDS